MPHDNEERSEHLWIRREMDQLRSDAKERDRLLRVYIKDVEDRLQKSSDEMCEENQRAHSGFRDQIRDCELSLAKIIGFATAGGAMGTLAILMAKALFAELIHTLPPGAGGP